MNILRLFILVVSFILISGQLVYGQDDEKEKERERERKDTMNVETEEVVITGTRTLKKIIDIPYSVFRVDTKEMVYGRDMNAKDVLQDVPGLFLQTRFGSDVRISIRGFGTRSNSGVRGIRILQDGIPESDPDGETAIDGIDFTSLGGVEVVKGNQSSLYTNSPGGVINFLSDVSFDKNFVKLVNQAGEYNLRQSGLKVGLRTNDFRFFTSYNYKNVKGFRQHSSEYNNLVNSYFQAYLSHNTSLTIMGNYTKSLVRLPGALTREEYDQNPSQASIYAKSYDFKRITNKGRLGVRINNSFGRDKQNEIEYTGYGAIKDLEGTDINVYTKRYKYVLGNTLRFTNRTPLFKRDNEFSCGIDYFYVTGPLANYNNVAGNKGDEIQSQNIETQDNLGGYLQNQINLVKNKLYFLVSGRYDKVIFENTDEFNFRRNSERKFDRFTPKFAFNFKINPVVSLYTSYGFGFDTPSAAELENFQYTSNGGATTLNPDLAPQTSRNFEVGIKGSIIRKHVEFMKKAFFEFTFFNTQIKNEIVPLTVSSTSFYRNAAQTNRTGLECGMKLMPFEETDVIINYTYTHFRYKSYLARSYDEVGNPVDHDYTNNWVPAVPRHLTNFIVEKEFELTDNITGIALFDCDYVSKMYADDANTESTGDYFYANTMIGANCVFNKFNILFSAGLNNFLNRQYVGYINVNANPELPIYQRRYFESGEPRNFFVNLNLGYRF